MDGHFKKITVICLSLIILLPVLIWTVNLSSFDERLEPEVTRLIGDDPSAAPVAGDNVYYALMGIYSSEDSNPLVVGRRRIEAFNTSRQSLQTPVMDDYDPKLEPSVLQVNKLSSCDQSTHVSCLRIMEKNKAKIEQLAGSYQEYLQRYATLLDERQYKETVFPDFNAPVLPNLLPLQSLFVAHAYLQNRRQPDSFFDLLDKHLEFQRMLLVRSDSLLTKMLSVRSIRFSTAVLSEYFTQYEASEQQAERFRLMLRPLSADELDISEAFIHEFKMIANAVFDYAQARSCNDLGAVFDFSSCWMYSQLTQPNATVNTIYRLFMRDLLTVAGLSEKEFSEWINKGLTKETSVEFPGQSWNPYNYGGRQFLSVTAPDFLSYVKTMHDLNGMLYLNRLKLRLKTHSGQSDHGT
jgi:hypothetical protein